MPHNRFSEEPRHVTVSNATSLDLLHDTKMQTTLPLTRRRNTDGTIRYQR
jgi:hypothetical protein